MSMIIRQDIQDRERLITMYQICVGLSAGKETPLGQQTIRLGGLIGNRGRHLAGNGESHPATVRQSSETSSLIWPYVHRF